MCFFIVSSHINLVIRLVANIMANFWIGPYDVRVPNSVDCVKWKDDRNSQYSFGAITEMPVGNILTKEEYLAKHAELMVDGHYWYISEE